MSQPPEDHLKALWQGQPTESPVMTVQAVRARAARFVLGKRLTYMFTFALLAFEVAAFGHFAFTTTNPGAKVGLLAILVGLGWATALFSLGWPRRMPGSAASGQALLEFHRAELERQQVGFKRTMLVVGPMIAGLVIFAVGAALYAPHPNLMRAAPLMGFLAIWFVVAWFMARLAERRRRKRLAELDATRVDALSEE